MEKQKTISKSFALLGKGLQTGKPVKAVFYPAKEDEGITFVRSDVEKHPFIRLDGSLNLEADRRSRINFSKTYVETIEHVLAALWGAGIDNINIELNNSEPPALDGSAKVFLEEIRKAGIEEQKTERQLIEISEPLWTEDKESFLGVFPASSFKISYVLEYPGYLPERQFYSANLDGNTFEKDIAAARTIWLVPPGPGSIDEKARLAKTLGYGRGADKENVLIIAKDGAVNDARFPDEPVRHKVLDLIGDLYLLGKRIKGRVIAIRSGHKLNLELVKKIKPACPVP